MKEVRNILVHYHMFKNAGTTFDSVLEANLGEAFCDHRDDEPMRQQKAPYLKEFLLANEGLRAISSHHMCTPLPTHPSLRLHRVYFLRNPIERASSVYRFERIQQVETPGAIHAKKYSFRDYVKWRMEPQVPPTIREYQVRTIVGKTRPKLQMAEKDLLEALQLARSTPFTGLVEQFDASLALFKPYMDKLFPGFSFEYERQNVNEQNVKAPLVSKIAQIADELGDMYDELVAANQMDLRLWQYFNDELAVRQVSLGVAMPATEITAGEAGSG